MKRLVSIVLILVCIFSLSGCGKNDTYKISITVPAGTAGEFTYIEDFIYSDEEISPIGDTITVSSVEGLPDTEVVLKPIEVKEENAYERTYLTPGMPVEMDVVFCVWCFFCFSLFIDTEEDISFMDVVEGGDVRFV